MNIYLVNAGEVTTYHVRAVWGASITGPSPDNQGGEATMSNRFYIGKKEPDELEDLEEWIADRVPLPPPEGTLCEDERHETELFDEDEEGIRPPATTFVYRIEDGHVCYTYVCDDCGERADPEYLADQDYPVTDGGYAVTPRHCA